jgi:hypothetical protein
MKDMTTAQMVAEYNQLTGKSIKKFSDRATGEKQLAKARAEHTPLKVKVTENKDGKNARAEKAKREKMEWPFPTETATPTGKKIKLIKEERGPDDCPNCGATEDQTPDGLEGTVGGETRNNCNSCGIAYNRSTGKVYNAPKVSGTRGQGTAESWKNKKVAKARATRIGVKVGGNVYKSTREAFEVLRLPAGKYPFVRVQLKEHGTFVFEGHKFSVVNKL